MAGRKLQRRARILALQVLYAQEQQRLGSKADEADVLDFSWLDREASSDELLMAKLLVQGVGKNLASLDENIIGELRNWTMDRLLAVDRAILRLGCYMLQFLLDTPSKVIIDECVNLCHSFSSEQSYRLVNGVLHSLSRKFRSELENSDSRFSPEEVAPGESEF